MKTNIVIRDGAKIPTYATKGSAGLDLYSNEDTEIHPYLPKAISTGIMISIPPGHVGYVCPRSGLSLKGITVYNAPGIIDSDYRAELQVILMFIPLGGIAKAASYPIKRGDRIAQLLISKVENIDFNPVLFLDETVRGTGGLGSTGV
jgi:dUTP pyrophosphatase